MRRSATCMSPGGFDLSLTKAQSNTFGERAVAASASARPRSTIKTLPPGSGTSASRRIESGKSTTSQNPSPPTPINGNGSGAHAGFNQFRNEFLTVARRLATAKKQPIGEVVEWASGGTFKYGDGGTMTAAGAPKLRAATELMAARHSEEFR